MSPAQLSPQCGDNLRIGEGNRELDHSPQILVAKPSTVTRVQLSPQCGDNLRAVRRASTIEYLRSDTLAELPVKRRERGVRRICKALTSSLNHSPEIERKGSD